MYFVELLYCTVLYCIALQYYFVFPSCVVLHGIALHCIVLYCVVLYCIELFDIIKLMQLLNVFIFCFRWGSIFTSQAAPCKPLRKKSTTE